MDEILKTTLLVLANISVVVVSIVGYFIFLKHLPNMCLSILPRWYDTEYGLLIVRIEIKNPAKLRVYKKLFRLQVSEYEKPNNSISEWVWFDNPANKKEGEITNKGLPIIYNEPVDICESTTHFNPGDLIIVERIHKVDPKNIVKIGVQYESGVPVTKTLVEKFYNYIIQSDRWTQTVVVDYPTNEKQSNQQLNMDAVKNTAPAS